MSKIIYLNGPSSCGKTVLAKALQETLSDPYLHIGIDRIIDFMPAKLNNWEGGFAEEGFCWVEGSNVHAGPFAKRITNSLKDIAVLLAQQYNLIIDDVSFGAVQVDQWKEVLKPFDVLYVGVVAPLEILEQREKERGDRFHGSARAQYFKVHENVAYDLELNTHEHSIEECVELINQSN